jgi:hypothetical protein
LIQIDKFHFVLLARPAGLSSADNYPHLWYKCTIKCRLLQDNGRAAGNRKNAGYTFVFSSLVSGLDSNPGNEAKTGRNIFNREGEKGKKGYFGSCFLLPSLPYSPLRFIRAEGFNTQEPACAGEPWGG